MFVVCTILCCSFVISANEIPVSFNENYHLSIVNAQEQEIPPIAPTVPQTPNTQTPNPQNPPLANDFSNNTESTGVPISNEVWQTYENLSDAIHIDHPASWEKTQQGNNVIFLAPLDPSGAGGSFRTGVGIIEVPSLGMTLDSFVNKTTSELQSRVPAGSFVVLDSLPLPGFKQGMDGLKSVYQWDDPRAGGLLKIMETYMVTPDKAFTISYAAPISLFDKYLPVAQRMIDSFQLVGIVPGGQGMMTGNATQLESPTTNLSDTISPENLSDTISPENLSDTIAPEQSQLTTDQNTSSQMDLQLGNFLTYSNSTSGITLEYPSNWAVDDYGGVDSSGVKGLVTFYPYGGRTGGDTGTFAMVSLDPYVGNSISANEYLNKSIESLIEMLGGTISNYSNFKVIDSKTTDKGITLSGNPAYQIVYTYSLNGVPTKGTEVGTVLNGKAYFLTFEAPVSNYDSSLPIIQKLINSFRLSTS